MKIPVLKLGTLAVRTIGKPIANRLKQDAGLHPKFRQFIINMAQTNHRFTTLLQRWSHGRATNVIVRPLNEEKAIEAAAQILGELFMFSVAGLAIVYEVQRNTRAEYRTEAKHGEEMEALKKRDQELSREVDNLKKKLKEVQQLATQRNCFNLFRYWQHAQTAAQKSA